jgi:hypothetical protein
MTICAGCGKNYPSNFLKPFDQQVLGPVKTIRTFFFCKDCRRRLGIKGR